MPEPTVQAIEISPGNWRWYGYPEHHFISGQEAISRLVPSLGGFHGHQGLFQPYGAVAQTLGEGIPTPKHSWWKIIESIENPTESIERLGARQYLATVEFMDFEGNLSERTFATKIGLGYDPDEINDRIWGYAQTGETPPSEALSDEEQLMPISQRTTQMDWYFVGMPRR